MRPNHTHRKVLGALMACAAELLGFGTVAAQIPQMAPQPVGALPVAQRPKTDHPQSQPGTQAPRPVSQLSGDGTIEGFVYWDANSIVHKPASDCSGLAITVSVAESAGGTAQSFKPVGTLGNNFKYLGQVKEFLAGGKIIVYEVCTYGFDHLPVGPQLQVTLSVSQLMTFSPVSMPQPAAVGPITIVGARCNTLPHIVNPDPSDLSAHWGTCQNMAYDVNFAMQPSAHIMSGGPGLSSGVPGAHQGLLPPAPQQGMLAPGTTQSAQPHGPAGTLLGNRLDAAGPPAQGGSIGVGKPGGSGGLPAGSNSPALSASMPSANFVPPMPPMKSNQQRDAAGPADEATKTQIRSKLDAQIIAAGQHTGRISGAAVKPAESIASEIRVLQQQKMFVDTLRTQGAQTIAPNAPNGAIRNHNPASDPVSHAPQPMQICIAPQIHAVNGKSSGVVFTQDPAYNSYVITGCRFDKQGGQVYLSGAVTGGRIDLVVKQWSDTQIEAVVDPGLTGVLDGWPDLIVTPSGGSSAKFPNCRFYAQRKSVLLPGVPQQSVTLANVAVGDGTHGGGTRYCPGPDVTHLFPCIAYNAGPPLDGITNGHDHRNDPNELVSNAVDRDGGQVQFGAGEDVYDLSSMAPGFEIDYSMVYWYAWTSDVCEGWASDAFPKKPGDSVGYDTEGHYGWYKKTNSKIVVDWGVDHCAWRWLGIFKVDDWYNSGYSLQVYVKGPIGVDPWTGHPTAPVHSFDQLQPAKVLPVH